MDTDIICKDAKIRNLLQGKLQGGDIAAEVAEEALAYGDPRGFFTDLAQHGCICGMV